MSSIILVGWRHKCRGGSKLRGANQEPYWMVCTPKPPILRVIQKCYTILLTHLRLRARDDYYHAGLRPSKDDVMLGELRSGGKYYRHLFHSKLLVTEENSRLFNPLPMKLVKTRTAVAPIRESNGRSSRFKWVIKRRFQLTLVHGKKNGWSHLNVHHGSPQSVSTNIKGQPSNKNHRNIAIQEIRAMKHYVTLSPTFSADYTIASGLN